MNTFVTPEEESRYAELMAMALDFARHGQTAELEAMLKAGMSPDLCDEKGQSLLMLASYNGNLETTQCLIGFGADVNQRNDRGQTPLAGAAFKGNVAIVRLLVENGADIHADSGMGMTAVGFAHMFGQRDVVDYLQAKGAKLSIREQVMGLPARFMARK